MSGSPRSRRCTAIGLVAGLLLASIAVLADPVPAGAATTADVTAFTDPSMATPYSMTAGPDGNVWYANVQGGKESISRITPAGVVTTFTHPNVKFVQRLAAGPDGAIWFANAGDKSIGRLTASGAFAFYKDDGLHSPWGLAWGPDGNLWFTDAWNLRIGYFSPSAGDFTYTEIGEVPSFLLRDIVAGPDGKMWFSAGDRIGRINTDLSGLDWLEPEGLTLGYSMTTGPDGNVWIGITNPPTGIGRLTPAGVFTKFTDPELRQPYSITTGPDGALWFSNGGGSTVAVGRITTAGAITMYRQSIDAPSFGIAAGADGNIWFTNDRVVRLNLGGSPPPPPDTAAPTVTMDRPSWRWNLSRIVPVSWTGRDAGGSGVKDYDVARRAAGYATLLPTSSTIYREGTTSTKAPFIGSKGATYCMNVRARDVAGNQGAYSGGRCTAIPFTADQLQYFGSGMGGTWRDVADPAYYGGRARISVGSQPKVTLAGIRGARRIALVTTTCPSCGFVAVYWNGTYVRTVSLQAATTQNRRVVDVLGFSGPADGRVSIVAITGAVRVEGLAVTKSAW